MEIFLNNNIIYLILLSQLLSIKAIKDSLNNEESTERSTGNEDNYRTLPLSNVKIKIMRNPSQSEHLNLELVKRVLANKFLPIWTVEGLIDENSILELNSGDVKLANGVMDRLGEFTTYHDTKTTSAAVYFHQRRQFDGVIDNRYLIRELSIDDIHETDETELWAEQSAIMYRKKSIGHGRVRSRKRKYPVDDKAAAGTSRCDETLMINKQTRVNNAYPEILVIVSCDIALELMKLESESERYTAVVSYILTLFNSVDMLFGKLKEKIQIQLNIAGIIIESGCNLFAFLNDCYMTETADDQSFQRVMDVKCTIKKITRFLFGKRKIIPMNSYDVVVYLTRTELRNWKKESDKDVTNKLNGLSLFITNIYKHRLANEAIVLVSGVHDSGEFGSYGSIAHELAHLMSVKHDTEQSNVDNKYCGHLMKEAGGWCYRCLSWSATSEELLKQFFSSPDCCTFINEPRSLYPPNPRQMLTADEQCQCYGYESAQVDAIDENEYCTTHLKCRDEHSIYDAPFPMDGTPCNDNEVCWGWYCKAV